MKRLHSRLTTLIFASFIYGVLLGCASSPVDFSEGVALGKHEGIVFGRVILMEDGKAKSLSDLFGTSSFKLILVREKTSQASYLPINEDGTFIWHLAEGDYTIAGYEWRNSQTGRIFAKYEALQNQAVYIGTLVITLIGPRFAIAIKDDFSTTSQIIMERFPALKLRIGKKMMQLEARR